MAAGLTVTEAMPALSVVRAAISVQVVVPALRAQIVTGADASAVVVPATLSLVDRVSAEPYTIVVDAGLSKLEPAIVFDAAAPNTVAES